MVLYIFLFGKSVFQLVNMSFMSPIWILYHLSGFSQLAYNNTIFPEIRGSLNKFPDFFRMGTFIDSTHMKL